MAAGPLVFFTEWLYGEHASRDVDSSRITYNDLDSQIADFRLDLTKFKQTCNSTLTPVMHDFSTFQMLRDFTDILSNPVTNLLFNEIFQREMEVMM